MVASRFEQRKVNWAAARARYDISTGVRTGPLIKDWELPSALNQVDAKLKPHADGDRQFIKALGAVLDQGLSKVKKPVARPVTICTVSAAIICVTA